MFEKSLQDLVKTLRAVKGDPAPVIAKAIQDIKDELKSRDVVVKAQALQKLCYLNMLGHDMSWAAFHVIEVMSQERFGLKRIGFMAASQSFTPATDVIVLCTALLKKEFGARSAYEVGIAINCLANIATEDLSRDLLSDVVTMLTSSRAYVRKKATLLLYKLYLRYPQGLRLTFDNLKRKLADENPSTVSCAVNVVCELARKKPGNYLSLAPELFALLTSSSNNWMLIKVAKLMSALVQEEPRLARKLLEPLANIVQTTPAKSLMYECVSTLTYALQHTRKADGSDAKNAPAVVRLCTDKLREMVRDPDQNLKYLGLTGLMNLMLSHPRVVAEHRELVLQCLVDEDVTIRLRALELITGMVTRRNLPDIVARLLELLEGAEGHWRDELIAKVIFMCSRDRYAYCADFAWFIGVLARLARIQGSKHSATVAGQLLEVAVRVEDVRPFAVQTTLPMLADAELAAAARVSTGAGAAGAIAATGASAAEAAAAAAEASAGAGAGPDASSAALALAGAGALGSGHALFAAAWIAGEYCAVIPPPMHGPVLDALLQAGTLSLPAPVQCAYIQTALKVLAAAANTAVASASATAGTDFVALAASVVERLHPFATSVHVEVQERACLTQQLLATLGVPFTPLPTPVALAAAKAKAEDDLMALAAAPAASPASAAASAGRPAAPPAPLEADARVIASVLGPLFAEPLRPVNAKAQKRVPVPEGLDLDKWIRPEEERAAAAEEGAGSGRKSGLGGAGGSFRYESISFEDSYGVADEDNDDVAAGSSAGAAGAGGASGRKGGKKGGKGGDDDDDDAWLADMAKKGRKRDAELWGDNSVSATRGKTVLAAADRLARPSATAGGRGDPFYLKSSPSDSISAAAAAAASALDVDAIPMRKLGAGELGPRSSLDISIFGDFGKKAKAAAAAAAAEEGGASSGKKSGKKGKKSKKGGDDDDDDAAGAAGAAGAGSKAYKIAEDDDMPEGAAGASSDDEDAPAGAGAGGGKGGKKGGKSAGDALADVDLSTPLREDEVMPSHAHRTAGGAKAGGKGRGRARVLGADASAAAAAAPAEAAAGDDGKKKKKKKVAAADEAAAGAGGAADGKKKKTKKAAAAEAEAAVAAAAAASSAATPGGEEKKKKKKAKAAEEEAPAAAASPAPRASVSAAAASTPVSAATAAAAAAKLLQGDEFAAAEALPQPLGGDKVVRIAFAVSARPAAPGAAPASAGAGGSSPGGADGGAAAAAAAPSGGAALATVTLRVEPRSTKKTVDWVDLSVAAPEACGGVALQRAGLPAGEAAGSVRVASALKERLKGKNRAQKAALTFLVPDAALTMAVPVTVTYQVTGAAAPVTLTLSLVLRSSSLLLPTQVEAEAYRGLMVSEGASFTHAAAAVPVPAAAGKSGDEVLAMVCGALRSFAVARSPKHAILYARTPSGKHVTALLKQDEAGTAVNVTIKSVIPGHAAVLAADVTEALRAALGGAEKDEE